MLPGLPRARPFLPPLGLLGLTGSADLKHPHRYRPTRPPPPDTPPPPLSHPARGGCGVCVRVLGCLSFFCCEVTPYASATNLGLLICSSFGPSRQVPSGLVLAIAIEPSQTLIPVFGHGGLTHVGIDVHITSSPLHWSNPFSLPA